MGKLPDCWNKQNKFVTDFYRTFLLFLLYIKSYKTPFFFFFLYSNLKKEKKRFEWLQLSYWMRNNFSYPPIISILLVSSSVWKQGGKILFISTYCGNLDNDNKAEKIFIKHPFPDIHRRDQREWRRKGTNYYSKPYGEWFTISFT